MVRHTIGGSGSVEQSVMLVTNDPTSPVIYLTLKGHAPHDLSVHPDRFFIAAGKGEGAQRTLRVTGPEGMDVTKVTTEQALLTAELLPPQVPREGVMEWNVTLTLPPELPVGRHSDQVRILATHPERPIITVPVTIDVWSEILTSPSSAFFGFVAVGGSKALTVRAFSRSGRPFAVKEVVVDHPAMSAVAKRADGNRWRVDITCIPREVGIIRGKVVLVTDIPGEERIDVDAYADAQGAL